MSYRNFVHDQTTKIVFGPNGVEKLADLLKAHGASKVLFTFGGGSIRRTGLYDLVVAQLQGVGLGFVEHGGCQPNPRESWVDQGARIFNDQGCDFILSVGGGSVLDASKAIGMAAANPHSDGIWHYVSRAGTFQSPARPVGAIMTLSATGSECNANFVISREATLEKRPLNHPSARPCFTICDPQLTCSVDRWQTACGTADIISHLLEQYLHAENAVDVSDNMSVGIIRAVVKWGPVAMEQPDRYDARANLMWASTIALNGLLGAGHRSDWTSHALEHALSAVYDVAHGAGLACLIPYYLDYLSAQDAAGRIGRLGREVFGLRSNSDDLNHETALAFQRFFGAMCMPARLRDFNGVNITEDSLPILARKATQFGPVGSGGFKPVGYDEALRIFTAAYHGADDWKGNS